MIDLFDWFKSDQSKSHSRLIFFSLRNYFADKCVTINQRTSMVDFEKSITQYDAATAVDCLRNVRRLFRVDLLKRSIDAMSEHVATVVQLRQRFAISYATLCSAHYILGIGDRHLNNLMMSTRTARIVGIDFGHAFGSAITSQAIPELVPFRLTTQITTAMGPIGARTRFETAMTQCMRVMRVNRRLISDALLVFVREPSMDWSVVRGGSIDSKSNTSSALIAKSIKYARHKVKIAERKLDGDHPISIVCKELAEKYSTSIIDSIRANAFANISTTTDEEALTVIDQVRSLIDIAGDDAVLARIFHGWEPWL